MEILSQLVSQKLWGANLAGQMLMLQFGDRHDETKRSGRTVTVGAYALHVQCPWRVRDDTRIICGSDDDGIEGLENWLFSEPVICRVAQDALGGLAMDFADGTRLELFPVISRGDEFSEYWRLISRVENEKGHWVVSSRGIESL